ncbi:MAG: DHH family phosphoesterase [bacterium]|nr:DHH family phosphoesterase [bacterium]
MNTALRLTHLLHVVDQLPENQPIRAIITQVDPDAMGAAAGFRHLLSVTSQHPVRAEYCGSIGHPQNKFLFTKYDLRRFMQPVLTGQTVPPSKDPMALIDSCSTRDSRLIQYYPGIKPIIVIDHHRGSDIAPETPNHFIWIENVGAACTLVVELLQEAKCDLSPEEHQWLAVLLALGIYTDTKGLVSACSRDRAAYAWAMNFTDNRELMALINYPISESYYSRLGRAISTKVTRGPHLLTGIGYVDPGNGDDVSSVADLLMRMEGITLIIVWAIIGNTVRISARSADASFPLDTFMKEKFGPGSGSKITPDGHGEGGARLELPLPGIWFSPSVKDDYNIVVARRLEEIIFSAE